MSGKFRTAGDTSEGALDPRLGSSIASDIFAQQLKVSTDDLQQVVEVVSDAAGELPDRLQLLRTDYGRLRRPECGLRLRGVR